MATRIRRSAKRTPTQLDLALDGNYLNNITSDEMVAHLMCGTADQYAAAVLIESAMMLAADEAVDKAEEDAAEVAVGMKRDLNNISEEMQEAIADFEFERLDLSAFVEKMRVIATAADRMTNDASLSFRESMAEVKKVNEERAAKAASGKKKAQ